MARNKLLEDLVGAIRDGKDVDVLVAEAKKQTFVPVLKIWRTIRSDLFKNVDEVRGAYKVQNISIGAYADKILDKTNFSNEQVEHDLVVLTTAELTGKKEGGTTLEVFAGAARLGLEKISGDLVAILRSQYSDQPNGEWILMGMEPIADSDGSLSVLDAERNDDGNLWLNASYAHPGDSWNVDDRWVFVSPRKSR